MLLRQEKLGGVAAPDAGLREGERAEATIRSFARVFVRGIRQYLRRDFHPSDNANERPRSARGSRLTACQLTEAA